MDDAIHDSQSVSHAPELLEGLTRLDERLARIERRLDQLERGRQLERAAPALAAVAVDSVDDAARRLEQRGIDLQERMTNALATLERLTSSAATEQLARALELAEQVPALIAASTDAIDQHVAKLQARGVDLDERMQNALSTLDRLTDTQTTVLLTRLLDLASQAPNLVATLMDGFDQRFGALHDRGVDLEERLTTLARVAERLTTPEALGIVETLVDHLPNLDRLLSSGLLGSGPVEIVSRAGHALSEAQQGSVHPLGAFGLFRALSDVGVQHSLGFAIAFAREFGRTLEPNFSHPALPGSTRAAAHTTQ